MYCHPERSAEGAKSKGRPCKTRSRRRPFHEKAGFVKAEAVSRVMFERNLDLVSIRTLVESTGLGAC